MVQQNRPLIVMQTQLKNIPEVWLKIVEPRIERVGHCWLWRGAVDGDGEPVINFFDIPSGKRKLRQVKRIIAELFWTLEKNVNVVHHCGTTICLNPSHFYMTTRHWKHEDRKAMIKGKRANILQTPLTYTQE